MLAVLRWSLCCVRAVVVWRVVCRVGLRASVGFANAVQVRGHVLKSAALGGDAQREAPLPITQPRRFKREAPLTWDTEWTETQHN